MNCSIWVLPGIIGFYAQMVSAPGLPFQSFRCSRKFSTKTTRKVVCHLHSNRFFGFKCRVSNLNNLWVVPHYSRMMNLLSWLITSKLFSANFNHFFQAMLKKLTLIGFKHFHEKSNRFDKQSNNFARASRYFVHFLAVTARLRCENT